MVVNHEDNQKMNSCRTGRRIVCWLIGVLFLLTGRAYGQTEKESSAFSVWSHSIEASLKADLQSMEYIQGLKASADELSAKWNAELNTYRIKEPIFSNQLLSPMAPLKTLEDSYLTLTASSRTIASRFSEIKMKQEAIQKVLFQISELSVITNGRIQDIPPDVRSNPESKPIIAKLKDLAASLPVRKEKLQVVYDTYAALSSETGNITERYNSLTSQFEQAIENRKKQELMERKKFFESMGLQKIMADIRQLTEKSAGMPTRDFWADQFRFVDSSEKLFLGSFLLVFMIMMVLVFRVRANLKRLMNLPVLSDKYWTRIVVLLNKRSLFLIGATLFFFVIIQLERFQPKPAILDAVVNLLLVWLFSKWFMDALTLLKTDAQPILPDHQLFWIRIQIHVIRMFAAFYISISWLYTDDSAVIILGRILFAICLYFSNMVFWRISDNIKNVIPEGENDPVPSELRRCTAIMKPLTFVIIVSGFVLDVAGYGSLSRLWFTSWGCSFVVGLWGALTFKAIREWNPIIRKKKDTLGEEASEARTTVQWVAVQFLTLLWFAALMVLFVLSWSGKKAVLMGMFEFIRMPLTVGSMKFSLLGVIIAIPILLITRGLARVWRHIFHERFLGQSGMEEGLKDSVTTISIYAIWVIGIILALNALGFDSTSLTLVLGALGIGIGFGLQNIFNNFLSGIILLFERPIQVGDDIEMNGVWATVKKINVRSTIVQTYDNASLIIPNSDLISTQVTNWSFKDRRLRRNIDIGVAYGSDVELVRKTLLEVAENTSRVLKLPQADVIFKDFGDSALVFRLRIWTWVDYFYAVETEIRYGIDRLFKERGIVIAFPQMDVHIKQDEKPDMVENKPHPAITKMPEPGNPSDR